MGEAFLIASGKGGTGKTQTAINLGYCLSKMGHKVALIDADLLSSNTMFNLHIPLDIVKLNDFLKGKAMLHDTGYDFSKNFKILPGDYTASNVKWFKEKMFLPKFNKIVSEFHYTLVDCPPGIMLQPHCLYRATDRMLLVSNAEPPAVSDAAKTAMFAMTRGTKIDGLILNRVGRFSKELEGSRIKQVFSSIPIVARIPEDKMLPTATAYGRPVSELYPLAPSSRAFRKLAAKMSGSQYQDKLTLREKLKVFLGKY